MDNALVLLSGGLDSTVSLFWAKELVKNVKTITFNYGQKHRIEIASAHVIAGMARVTNDMIDLQSLFFHLKKNNPLLDYDVPVEQYSSEKEFKPGVEKTFVPGRNIIFLSVAASYGFNAFKGEPFGLVIGSNLDDREGYPDCREIFIARMEQSLNQGLFDNPDKNHVGILAPFINTTKRNIISMAFAMPVCFEALAYSHTCYEGKYPPSSYNHASLQRALGFHQAGLNDPLIVRAIREGLLPKNYPLDGYVPGTEYERENQ